MVDDTKIRDVGVCEQHCDVVKELQVKNERLKKELKQAYNDGLRAFAWWKDGVQYVGSCGTTLKEALKG